ncbi:hypothetical protein DRO61_00510, partial [Candidatus Bathyarchaeota archaeon]
MKILESLHDKISLGTCGWSYKEWVGPFYEKQEKSMLKAYTKIFPTVEIDSTFYAYPSKGTVMGWSKYSPEGFIFSAKLPKLITHEKRLDITQGTEDALQKFTELMEPLQITNKLGCILIQLPPSFDYEPNELEKFFRILPSDFRFAIEFRDLSWMKDETWKLLRKYQIAYTVVDEPLLPPEIHITSDFTYLRWHGHGTKPWYNYHYEKQELEPWIPKIKDTSTKVEKVYGYFNNHYHGYAPENCLEVLEMLGIITSEQNKIKQNIKKYFER